MWHSAALHSAPTGTDTVWQALRWALVVSLRSAPDDRITRGEPMHWEKGQSGGWLLVAVADTLQLCAFYCFW